MSYTHKSGTGTIFKNDTKTADTHPDYKGSVVTPDGVECWINLWVKRSTDKPPFFSVSIKPKVEQPKPLQPETVEAEVISDDLPF